MPLNVAKYLEDTDKLLDAAKMRVATIRSCDLSGFNGMAEMSFVHDFLKQAKVNADKLSRHFAIESTREAKRRLKAAKKAGR